MTEYIDRKKFLERLAKEYPHQAPHGAVVVGMLCDEEHADVQPVVLCDKCRWFDDTGYPNPNPEMPELRIGHCMILGRDVQACWFCASGERGDAE